MNSMENESVDVSEPLTKGIAIEVAENDSLRKTPSRAVMAQIMAVIGIMLAAFITQTSGHKYNFRGAIAYLCFSFFLTLIIIPIVMRASRRDREKRIKYASLKGLIYVASPGKEFVNGIVEGSIFAERYKICGAHRSELMQGKRSGYYFQAINYSSELGGGQTVVGIRLRKKSVILFSVIPKIMLTAAKKVGKVPLDNTTAGLANNQVVMVPKGSSTTSIPVEFIKLCAQQKRLVSRFWMIGYWYSARMVPTLRVMAIWIGWILPSVWSGCSEGV